MVFLLFIYYGFSLILLFTLIFIELNFIHFQLHPYKLRWYSSIVLLYVLICMVSHAWYVVKYFKVGLKTNFTKLNFKLFLKLKMKDQNWYFRKIKPFNMLAWKSSFWSIQFYFFHIWSFLFRLFIVWSLSSFFLSLPEYMEKRKKVIKEKRR